jgi:hypothetical protein
LGRRFAFGSGAAGSASHIEGDEDGDFQLDDEARKAPNAGDPWRINLKLEEEAILSVRYRDVEFNF